MVRSGSAQAVQMQLEPWLVLQIGNLSCFLSFSNIKNGDKTYHVLEFFYFYFFELRLLHRLPVQLMEDDLEFPVLLPKPPSAGITSMCHLTFCFEDLMT